MKWNARFGSLIFLFCVSLTWGEKADGGVVLMPMATSLRVGLSYYLVPTPSLNPSPTTCMAAHRLLLVILKRLSMPCREDDRECHMWSRLSPCASEPNVQDTAN